MTILIILFSVYFITGMCPKAPWMSMFFWLSEITLPMVFSPFLDKVTEAEGGKEICPINLVTFPVWKCMSLIIISSGVPGRVLTVFYFCHITCLRFSVENITVVLGRSFQEQKAACCCYRSRQSHSTHLPTPHHHVTQAHWPSRLVSAAPRTLPDPQSPRRGSLGHPPTHQALKSCPGFR